MASRSASNTWRITVMFLEAATTSSITTLSDASFCSASASGRRPPASRIEAAARLPLASGVVAASRFASMSAATTSGERSSAAAAPCWRSPGLK
ncbi:hypothetical protein M885DRAFT_521751 [Pelagophyceae sp. CCMP2097]|nr:hypothetical protein M885DRAFT_521751 [Pelagophyceae sp. CCMP2097]